MEDDSPERVFPVKIDGTESVGTLKEVIKDKKKPAFDLVPADTLELFKVRKTQLLRIVCMLTRDIAQEARVL